MKGPDKAVMRIARQSAGVEGAFAGEWKNELGSTMTVRMQGSSVTGTYTTAVSAGGEKLKPHPLIGNVDGNLIAFIVNWTDKAAITAWVGQLLDANTLYTLWQMTLTVDDPAEDFWESVWSGTDTFTKMP